MFACSCAYAICACFCGCVLLDLCVWARGGHHVGTDVDISVFFSIAVCRTHSLRRGLSLISHCLGWLACTSEGPTFPHLFSPHVNVLMILNQNNLKAFSYTSSGLTSGLVWCEWRWQLPFHLCCHCWEDLGHGSIIDYCFVCDTFNCVSWSGCYPWPLFRVGSEQTMSKRVESTDNCEF